jgi:antitoxin (DNA-binding transcriptional repressor) of toxin-antitoxin stability system
MKTLELKKAVGPLREYACARDAEPLVLTAHGKPVAALIRLPRADWESVSLSTNPKFMALIDRSRDRAKREGTIPVAEVRQRLGVPAKASRRRRQ